MDKGCKLGLLFSALILITCSKEYVQYCGQVVHKGYVIGASPCKKVFVLTTISPVDTVATYNLPDSVYHFLTKAPAGLYRNGVDEFLFTQEYQNKFPVTFTYEESTDLGDGCPRPALSTRRNHFDRAVTKHINIKCIKAGF